MEAIEESRNTRLSIDDLDSLRAAALRDHQERFQTKLIALKQHLIEKYGDPMVKRCIMYYVCCGGSAEKAVKTATEAMFWDFLGEDSLLAFLLDQAGE